MSDVLSDAEIGARHGLSAAAYDGARELRVEELACTRGAALIFDNLSFTVKAGEALLVGGANGSGKSSLLRQLAGLLPVAAGRIEMAFGAPDQTVHYLGHADGLKNALTVGETLAFEAALAGCALPAQISATLGLGARDWQFVGDLSAGQRRRLTLARLIIDPRPLWLLDEPMTALDTQARALVDALAQAHLAQGGMIVAASHEGLAFAQSEIRLGQAMEAGA